MKIRKYLEKKFGNNRNFVKKLKKNFKKFGVNLEHWERYPTYKQIKLDIAKIDLKKFLDTSNIPIAFGLGYCFNLASRSPPCLTSNTN